MIERLGARASRVAERIFPDPFVFAILLTFLTAALALALTPVRPLALIQAWMGPKGFFSDWILTFASQMCLILVTGHALASTPLVSGAIARLARLPRSSGGAAALVAAAAIVAALLNWGLGLIVGALLAREVGVSARRRGVKVHYPLVVAAGYVGLMAWHGGFSGSAPLKVTNVADIAGLVGAETAARVGPLPLDRTIGSALNLAVTGGILVLVPAFFYLLAPRSPDAVREAPEELLAAAEAARPATPVSLGERLTESYALGLGIAAAGFVYLALFYGDGGLFRLDPNKMNLTLLFLGLALHGTPGRYVRAVEQAVRGCGGIILQFPFYAGIMGIMQGSGLVEVFAGWANAVSTPSTLPLMTFLAACLVNLFIPSGGGQWAVQGPIVVAAALAIGVPVEKVVMALAYGDECTNMLQPFWALPLLGVTGLRAGDIMGYTAVVMLLALPIYIVPLLLL